MKTVLVVSETIIDDELLENAIRSSGQISGQTIIMSNGRNIRDRDIESADAIIAIYNGEQNSTDHLIRMVTKHWSGKKFFVYPIEESSQEEEYSIYSDHLLFGSDLIVDEDQYIVDNNLVTYKRRGVGWIK